MNMRFVPVMMSDKRFQEIDNRVRTSYPNACILYIDELENKELFDKYNNRKSTIKRIRGDVQEHQLFHGTNVNVIEPICSDGFKTEYNKTSAYGRGTYFAKNARYSFQYMKENNQGISYMFLSDVLVGKCRTFGANATINTNDYDNSVDNTSSPSIVVTPYNDGAFPRYIIAFHKNAR